MLLHRRDTARLQIAMLVDRQNLIPDETTCPSEVDELCPRGTIGLQAVFVALAYLHHDILFNWIDGKYKRFSHSDIVFSRYMSTWLMLPSIVGKFCRKPRMRRYMPSLPVSTKTLRRDWSKPMARMTTSIFSWNIRRKWRSRNWSIVLRAYPPAVSGSYILSLLGGTTRVCCGHRVTLLPHVEAHRYLSFGSTLKTKEKTCERCALSA